VALVACLAGLGEAEAHSVGISRGEYRVEGHDVLAQLTFARGELIDSLPELDANHDRLLSGEELAAARGALERTIVGGLEVRGAGPCPGALQDARLTEQDGLEVRAVYHCPAPATRVRVELSFLEALSYGHRHLAGIAAPGARQQAVVYAGQPTFEVALAGSPGPSGAVVSLFFLGIEHILTGYDHLAFLLGLILVGGRLRSLSLVVTAFTVAHSLTLGLAALGVWAPSPSLVEPAIALSIAYVGVENWFVADASRRWRITFPFGLIHGFGFAGALREIALPRAEVPLALVSFNAGVEAGQLAVLLLILPVVLWLRRRPWFAAGGMRGASAVLALAGLAWFVGRVIG
jgi:hydrogenase/urease accessory protein HupE